IAHQPHPSPSSRRRRLGLADEVVRGASGRQLGHGSAGHSSPKPRCQAVATDHVSVLPTNSETTSQRAVIRQPCSMTSPPTIDHSDPTLLVAIARADRSRLSGERRLALDELLAGAEPPYDRDPARWDAAIFLPINARVAANAFARTACWGEAWRVMVSAVAEPSEPGQAAELRLLEILLDVMHRGVEAAAARMIDGVQPLIGGGHRCARLSLLDRLHQLLLMTGRTDDSLRLLRLDRIAPWEQLSGVARLLTYARPEVVTITGEDQLVVGADRMRPYADAIAELWHRLPAIHH